MDPTSSPLPSPMQCFTYIPAPQMFCFSNFKQWIFSQLRYCPPVRAKERPVWILSNLETALLVSSWVTPAATASESESRDSLEAVLSPPSMCRWQALNSGGQARQREWQPEFNAEPTRRKERIDFHELPSDVHTNAWHCMGTPAHGCTHKRVNVKEKLLNV